MQKRLFILFISLFTCSIAKAKSDADEMFTDSSGKYYIEFIHNVYSRTGNDIHKVATNFITNYKEFTGTVYEDTANKRVVRTCKWTYRGISWDCVHKADIVAEVSIHYKDERTMVRFTNFRYENGKTACDPQGTLETLSKCPDCIKHCYIGRYIKFKAEEMSNDKYKADIMKFVKTSQKVY